MQNTIYEKAVQGDDLNRIFNMRQLKGVENYRIHVGTLNGTQNNYITSMTGDSTVISDLYVSDDAITSLRMV